MKILKIVLIVLAVAVAAVLGIAATKPDNFSVQRSASIKAPPEKISAVLSDFRGWQAWSPFEKMDPAMQRSYSGADKGKGAVYAWSGNGQAGAGRMEITEASAQRVALNLDFSKPMEGHNKVVFTLTPRAEATEVTWAMDGPTPFVSKVIQVFCDMDAAIGKYFEDGLANLKAVAEKL